MTRTPATGGLQAPISIGISMTELEAILEKFNTQPAVEEDLKKMGLQNPSQPQFGLEEITPELLTTTDDKEYTTMYSHQLSWFNYLTPILANVTSGLLQAENQMKLVDAAIRKRLKEQNKLRSKEEKLKDGDIDLEVLNDVIYQEAMLEAQRLKQYKLSLEAMTDIAGRNMKVISRQVEIRRITLDGQLMEGGIPNRGGFQPRPLSSRR
jgi:hypothetical protein